jgi:hypothetical protein
VTVVTDAEQSTSLACGWRMELGSVECDWSGGNGDNDCLLFEFASVFIDTDVVQAASNSIRA